MAIHRLAARRHAFDRVDDHQRPVIRGDRVIFRRHAEPRGEFLDEIGGFGIAGHVRGGEGAIPALGGGKSGAAEKRRADDAIAARLDHVRNDVVRLLGQLDPGLADTAVVQRLWIERLDLRQHGGIVRRLRIQPVAAEHFDAFLLDLRLIRVRQAHAVGTAVVQDVNRVDFQHLRHVVGHVRALERVRRDGAEIDRLAGWPVLLGEFRAGDIGVGRARRDRRQIALAENRCHRLARATHLRADRGDDVRVRHHLARVGRGLRRVVLAGRGGAVVQRHQLKGITGHCLVLVGLRRWP